LNLATDFDAQMSRLNRYLRGALGVVGGDSDALLKAASLALALVLRDVLP
jgi:hypothetical protein